MTDAEHAAQLRRVLRCDFMLDGLEHPQDRHKFVIYVAAIERAIELLERQHRIDTADGTW